ncbi:hypothetical protein H696_04505 [Fonticula alba]|uniref:Uncharacterized protein n=1 Tax=Fonticula alba TaxID=691883 RepID=A0A058Z4A9_FONAL|nr:hypothetical protein H696_04505 [Fonticula alba]KCV69090.1 hypothetical protein H696_04505 [Fonticula alba]|eukprot:XP_009496661.1 hypothetical protein H696_04505 [Fonticula alba]
MNGIIHQCSHNNTSDAPLLSDDELAYGVFAVVNRLAHLIRPRKMIYLALDGVAPRAKLNQQRSRRFTKAPPQYDDEEGAPAPVFDTNSVTPGTELMDDLGRRLRHLINLNMNMDPVWRNVQVIFSGTDCPGEGEHKIMSYIRQLRQSPDHDPNTSHCLYGLDSDLIMLSLVTHEPHFCLLREQLLHAPPFNRPTNAGIVASTLSGSAAKQPLPPVAGGDQYTLFYVGLLRETLDLEFRDLDPLIREHSPNPADRYNPEAIYDDFVALCMLVGNDFLPNLPSLYIPEGSLNVILETYRRVRPHLGGYINESGVLNAARLRRIFIELADLETAYFDSANQASLISIDPRDRLMVQQAVDSPEHAAALSALGAGGSSSSSSSRKDARLSAVRAASASQFPPDVSHDLLVEARSDASVSDAGAAGGATSEGDGLGSSATAAGSGGAAPLAELPGADDDTNAANANNTDDSEDDDDGDASMKSFSPEFMQAIQSALASEPRHASAPDSSTAYKRTVTFITPSQLVIFKRLRSFFLLHGLTEPALDEYRQANQQIAFPATLTPMDMAFLMRACSDLGLSYMRDDRQVIIKVPELIVGIMPLMRTYYEAVFAAYLNAPIRSRTFTATPAAAAERLSLAYARSRCVYRLTRLGVPQDDAAIAEALVTVDGSPGRDLADLQADLPSIRLPDGQNIAGPFTQGLHYLPASQYRDLERRPDYRALVDRVSLEYYRGLQWVLYYYYHGIPSWGWFFPMYYSPLISDLARVELLQEPALRYYSHFDLQRPLDPFEQLLSVLPPASAALVPEGLRPLMSSDPAQSPVADFFPADFHVDLNGKMNDWESVVLVNFIDIDRLREVMALPMSRLPNAVLSRNQNSMEYFVFRHDPSVSYELALLDTGVSAADGAAPAPGILGGTIQTMVSNIAVQRHVMRYAELNRLTPIRHFGLLPGVRLGADAPLGLPTFHSLAVRKQMIFMSRRGQTAKNETLALRLPTLQFILPGTGAARSDFQEAAQEQGAAGALGTGGPGQSTPAAPLDGAFMSSQRNFHLAGLGSLCYYSWPVLRAGQLVGIVDISSGHLFTPSAVNPLSGLSASGAPEEGGSGSDDASARPLGGGTKKQPPVYCFQLCPERLRHFQDHAAILSNAYNDLAILAGEQVVQLAVIRPFTSNALLVTDGTEGAGLAGASQAAEAGEGAEAAGNAAGVTGAGSSPSGSLSTVFSPSFSADVSRLVVSPLQSVILGSDWSDSRFLARPPKTIDQAFPIGSTVLLMGSSPQRNNRRAHMLSYNVQLPKHNVTASFGQLGTVLGYLKNGHVAVELYTPPPPSYLPWDASIEPKVDTNQHWASFFPLMKVGQLLNVSTSLILRVISRLRLVLPNEGGGSGSSRSSHRSIEIGLNMRDSFIHEYSPLFLLPTPNYIKALSRARASGTVPALSLKNVEYLFTKPGLGLLALYFANIRRLSPRVDLRSIRIDKNSVPLHALFPNIESARLFQTWVNTSFNSHFRVAVGSQSLSSWDIQRLADGRSVFQMSPTLPQHQRPLVSVPAAYLLSQEQVDEDRIVYPSLMVDPDNELAPWSVYQPMPYLLTRVAIVGTVPNRSVPFGTVGTVVVNNPLNRTSIILLDRPLDATRAFATKQPSDIDSVDLLSNHLCPSAAGSFALLGQCVESVQSLTHISYSLVSVPWSKLLLLYYSSNRQVEVRHKGRPLLFPGLNEYSRAVKLTPSIQSLLAARGGNYLSPRSLSVSELVSSSSMPVLYSRFRSTALAGDPDGEFIPDRDPFQLWLDIPESISNLNLASANAGAKSSDGFSDDDDDGDDGPVGAGDGDAPAAAPAAAPGAPVSEQQQQQQQQQRPFAPKLVTRDGGSSSRRQPRPAGKGPSGGGGDPAPAPASGPAATSPTFATESQPQFLKGASHASRASKPNLVDVFGKSPLVQSSLTASQSASPMAAPGRLVQRPAPPGAGGSPTDSSTSGSPPPGQQSARVAMLFGPRSPGSGSSAGGSPPNGSQ